jgi:drug/metabolite transporter (DMT)-like permease
VRKSFATRPRRAEELSPAIPALLGAMTIWGATYVVTKSALDGLGPFTVLFARLAIGLAALVPFAWRQGYRPSLSLRKEFVLFGLTGMVLHLGLEIVGLQFTSASSAALIIATAPALTVGFSVLFLKERLSTMQGVGIAVSILGVVLITGAQSSAGYPLGWLGNLFVFGGVVVWGIYTVQGRKMSTNHSWLVATTAATGAAALLVAPIAAGEMIVTGPPSVTIGGVLAVLYLGVGASAVAFGLWNLALRDVGGSVAGPYISLVPAIGVVLALLVGESLTVPQVIGGVTVAVGVWLSYRGSSARSAGKARPRPSAATPSRSYGGARSFTARKETSSSSADVAS